MDTQQLISELSRQVRPTQPLRHPFYWTGRVLTILVIYGLAAQWVLGLRPDLEIQLGRPLFVLEIVLLALLGISGISASIVAMYPDAYQKPLLLKIPYVVFGLLCVLIGFQIPLSPDGSMVDLGKDAHHFLCTLCIAAVAFIPAGLLFMVLCKGASVYSRHAGAFAVLSSSAIGCLTLRLAEAHDVPAHLAEVHYFPTFLFALGGAVLGKWLLRW
jgi:hypothetical protein